MVDLRNEPSMEDILASIKRIIAEDGAAAMSPPRVRTPPRAAPPAPVPAEQAAEAPAAAEQEEVLELTQPAPEQAPEIVSDQAAAASRQSLAALSAVVVSSPAGADPGSNTLEGLVREMLRPMLKEWLDARLPELVEGLVAREIARITGKSL